MTNTPAGWYPVPGGGKRFWNGRAWTSDVIGAPSREAEYDALAPDLAAPNAVNATQPTVPLPQAHAPAAPGWYPSPAGSMQWWDGRAWGPVAPPNAMLARPPKETGIAYLFFILLGGAAAHRFYLGLTASAIIFNVIWWSGWILAAFAIGIPLLVAGVIWLLVDLFLIPSLVRRTNAERGYYG